MDAFAHRVVLTRRREPDYVGAAGFLVAVSLLGVLAFQLGQLSMAHPAALFRVPLPPPPEAAIGHVAWIAFAMLGTAGLRLAARALLVGRHARTRVQIDQHRVVIDKRTWRRGDIVAAGADGPVFWLRTNGGHVETFGPFVDSPRELRHLVGIVERICADPRERAAEARARTKLIVLYHYQLSSWSRR